MGGNKYRSSTFVDLSHSEMALRAAFRTGSIFEACSSLRRNTEPVFLLSIGETQSQGCVVDFSK